MTEREALKIVLELAEIHITDEAGEDETRERQEQACAMVDAIIRKLPKAPKP